MEIVLGPFSFSSNFECGNLAKVLPIHLTGSTPALKSTKPINQGSISDVQVDYEFNLWTKPDCSGTEFENNNRTWFFFCIKGGLLGEKVQLSVMNLNKQSKLYSQGMQPVVRCVGDYGQSSNWERIKEKCSYRSEDNSTVVSWVHTVPPENRVTYYAFTYPYTYTQLQTFLRNLDERFSITESTPYLSSPANLYYYRELLTYSLDGSRVDLLTISSHLGKKEEREDSLGGLFPESNRPRPYRFADKRVVFISARVHPGETPSSFVMSGFINFLLSSDVRAARMRDRFVFKIIPMLNPDGVTRGHYRTDQRGVNLNRVYCDPSPDLHPTIYAARKVILYYHYGMSAEPFAEAKLDQALSSSVAAGSALPQTAPPLLDEDTCHSFSDAVVKAESSSGIAKGSGKICPILDADEPSASGWDCSSNMSADSSCRSGSLQNHWDDFQEESSQRFFGDGGGGETGVTSMFDSMSPLRDFKILSSQPFKAPSKSINFSGNLPPIAPTAPSLYVSSLKQNSCDKAFEAGKPRYSFRSEAAKEDSSSSAAAEALTPKEKVASILSLRPSALKDSASKLFMYMDFHGHASKRGIFMYGNWFEDPVLMVENMLYPKLLSLHCSNFDFGACNFSERNMYHRDRRDGMSKEGSGRVAVMRATGLIRSYTLECNYNTGRFVNPTIHSAPAPTQRTSFGLHGVPPKYTPATFEDSVNCGAAFPSLREAAFRVTGVRKRNRYKLGRKECHSWPLNLISPSQCGHKLGICLHDLVEADNSSKCGSDNGAVNLNVLRRELFSLLSSSSFSPRTSNLSSCSQQGSTPSPKTIKGLKCSPEDIKCAKGKSSVVTMPKINVPVGAFSTKQPSAMRAYGGGGGGRRQSLSLSSSSVDAENQEPQPQRPRTSKTKSVKTKKDPCGADASQTKTKKFRHKSTCAKKDTAPQAMLFKDQLGEPSHAASTRLPGGAVCFAGDGGFKMATGNKPDSVKLMKKIEKGRKQRSKTLKFGSKKLKNMSSCEASSTSFKQDQFGQKKKKEEDGMEPCCVSNPNPNPNPLSPSPSPRSPLASVFESQTGQGSQAGGIALKQQQSPTFVGGPNSKGSFHPCAKRQPKSLKTGASPSDPFPIGPPTPQQRIKLFPKKVKKKGGVEAASKSLSKPTTSQTPLQWVIRKPFKIGSEVESANPRVKKRKKSARKSI